MKRVQYVGPKASISCVVPFGARSKGAVERYIIFKSKEILELEDDYAAKLVAHSPVHYRFAEEDQVLIEEMKPAKKVKSAKVIV